MKSYKTLILSGLLLALLALPSIASAAIGHIEPVLDITYSIDDSFDGVSGDNYLIGGGVRLEFDILWGFSAGAEYNYTSKDGNLFGNYDQIDTSYELHMLKFNLRWRYEATSWFEPYVLFTVGPDFHSLSIKQKYSHTLVNIDDKVKLGIGGLVGMRFQLAESWMKSWKPWDGFNLGFYLESGYIYRAPLAVNYQPAVSSSQPGAIVSERKLGKLKSGGPTLRMGVFWRF